MNFLRLAKFLLYFYLLDVTFAAASPRATVKRGLISSVLGLIGVNTTTLEVCDLIKTSVSSNSGVFFPGSPNYVQDISHWMSSSTDAATCSFEPGTPEDVSVALQILAAARAPFAVKGGGHASNPGFSSTKGVQIAMSRFNKVDYSSVSQSVKFGSGLIWDDVYAALQQFGVNVIGGRVSGVGVAGFTLGGGYSWMSNQHGLTVDTVLAYELVKPNGVIVNVTEQSDKNLFWALKGGMNNFGIVTSFTLKTFPIPEKVWGGLITYSFPNIPAVAAATAKFSATVTDPKAAIITAVNTLGTLPVTTLSLIYFAPTPPAGIFDDFLAIQHVTKDVETRPFLEVVKAAPAGATRGMRGIFNQVSFEKFSPAILDAIVNETMFWGPRLLLGTSLFISYDVEPFLPQIFDQLQSNLGAQAETAYPPPTTRTRSLPPLPLNLYFSWAVDVNLPILDILNIDEKMHDAIRRSTEQLKNVAERDGQTVRDAAMVVYPNYAIFGTPLQDLYGENVGRLRQVKATVDPGNIMGLAGGWKL